MARDGVFLSYRRDDTGFVVGHVYDRLIRIYPRRKVFFDIGAIKGGEDFRARIAGAVGNSDRVLVFIGARWLDPSGLGGQPRLFDPKDVVRFEVKAALDASVLVLPIVVGNARMPKPEDVPEELAAICNLNALPLRHESFAADFQHILATLARRGEDSRDGPGWVVALRLLMRAIVGALGSAIIMILLAWLHFRIFGRPVAASIGDFMTILAIVLSLSAGVVLSVRYGHRS